MPSHPKAPGIPIAIDSNQTLDAMLHQILNLALVAVGAESGSLMLVDNKRGILQIKARLGKPREGRRTEPVYKLADNSIAAWVVKHRKGYLCSDVETDRHFHKSRSKKNFNSLLSVPIIDSAKKKVLGVINADAKKRNSFSREHLNILKNVAAQVAAPMAHRVGILDALSQVGVELSRLPGEGGVNQVLKKIAQLALQSLGAEVVTLYQYIQETGEFTVPETPLTIAGELRNPGPMRRRIYKGDVPWTVVKERKSGFYSSVRSEAFLAGQVNRSDGIARERFIDREGIQSMAALLLPSRAVDLPNEEVVGVMFVSYRRAHDFNIDEIKALENFADYSAVAIQNARREEQRGTEKLKMAESILTSIAHRLGNLVGISRAAAQTLKDRINKDDSISRERLEAIEQKADALHELTERVLRPVKQSGRFLEPQFLDFQYMLNDELKRLSSATAAIKIVVNLPNHLPRVRSVDFQLREVVHDVLNNAVEAMQNQKKKKLAITGHYIDGSHFLEIDITDSGHGIEDAIGEKLFTAGVTTKKGLGIGLWWSRNFMRATGGDLILKNTQPNIGTTFTLRLPCEHVDAHFSNRERPNQTTTDILIVENEADWASILRGIFEPNGYRVDVAATFADATLKIQTQHYKLMVLDLGLDDTDANNQDGLKLLSQLDGTGRATKVIILTAHAFEQSELTARQSPNMIRFLDKARFQSGQLLDLVNKVLR